MNKYYVQIKHRDKSIPDYLVVYAQSDQEALQYAEEKLSGCKNPVILLSDDYRKNTGKTLIRINMPDLRSTLFCL